MCNSCGLFCLPITVLLHLRCCWKSWSNVITFQNLKTCQRINSRWNCSNRFAPESVMVTLPQELELTRQVSLSTGWTNAIGISMINWLSVWTHSLMAHSVGMAICHLWNSSETRWAKSPKRYLPCCLTKWYEKTINDDERSYVFGVNPPEPKVPRIIFSPALTLAHIDEVEIARQLCLIDFDIFSQIVVKSCS